MLCLSSSMGGCAPYSSTCGMLRSSTNTTIFLPIGGPNTPLRRLSSFPSTTSCVWFAEVCAEKFMNRYDQLEPSVSSASREMCRLMYAVLPVPVGPTNRKFTRALTKTSMRKVYRIVSTVGTMMSVYCAPSGMGVSSRVLTQATHLPEGLSNTKSYTVASLPSTASGKSCVTLRFGGRFLVMNACSASGTSPMSKPRSVASNFARPSSSTEAPTDHTSANRNSESSHVSSRFLFISAASFSSRKSASSASSRRMHACARLISCIGCGILHSLVARRTQGGRSQSNRLSMCALCSSNSPSGSVCIQETITGRHPSRDGCTYTMPHRETVAGDATARSCTSKIMFIRPCMAMISPEFRHSFLLSSSTVFMFSIQMASTGPSNTTHLRSGDVSRAALRNVTAKTPSAHSLETGSSAP